MSEVTSSWAPMNDPYARPTLTDFLLARIAEDEAEARKAGSFTPWDRTFERDNYGHLLVQPARVLAECEAKRRIVDLCEDNLRDLSAGGTGRRQFSSYALQILALPYADHPDFREEWRL